MQATVNRTMETRKAGEGKAFIKAGFYGFQGTGKTFTAAAVACGVAKRIRSDHIFFFDTEGGVDDLLTALGEQRQGIEILVPRIQTVEFTDLVKFAKTVAAENGILVVDSLTNVSEHMRTSFLRRRSQEAMQIQDWEPLRMPWREDWLSLFKTGTFHCFALARVGYQWESLVDQQGRLEHYRTATKMQAEADFGHEPSCVVYMERIPKGDLKERFERASDGKARQRLAQQMMQEREFVYRATVEKERRDMINGETFINPTYEDFRPLVESVLGGKYQAQITATGDTEELWRADTGNAQAQERNRARQLALEHVATCILKHMGGTSKDAKLQQIEAKERAFGAAEDTYLDKLPLAMLVEWTTPDPDTGMSRFEVVCSDVEEGRASARVTAKQLIEISRLRPDDPEAYQKLLNVVCFGLTTAKELSPKQADELIAKLKGEPADAENSEVGPAGA